MSEYISAALRRLVRECAVGRCEYCLIHDDDAVLPHEPDHVVALKHYGKTEENNLAWTCFVCNRAKGSDIASINIRSGNIVRLFSPRSDKWSAHFSIQDDGTVLSNKQ